MPEGEVAVTLEAQPAPAAPQPAEVVKDQNIAVEATATPTDGEKPETEVKPETPQPDKVKQSKFDRKINRLYKEAAEQKARADFLESKLNEARPVVHDDAAPKLEQFEFDAEKYAEALAEYKVKRLTKEQETRTTAASQRAMQERLQASWEKQLNKAEDEFDDFDQVVGDLKPTTPWAIALMKAENGYAVAHHLGKNMAEASRIAALDPIDQFIEIGRLSAKLAAEPVKPKTPSQAPEPIKPVGAKSGGANDQPTDSDDIKTWMKKENARMKKAAA